MDIVEIQAIYYMVAATGVLVAAVFYILNLRATQRNMRMSLETRQAQLLMNIYDKWSQPEFQEAWSEILSWEWRDYDDFSSKYFDRGSSWKMNIVGSLFEGLGVYVKRGFIDATLVDDLMSSYIVSYWQRMSPIFIEYRKRRSSPTTMEYAEYLYNVIYEIWRREHPETPEPLAARVGASVGDAG